MLKWFKESKINACDMTNLDKMRHFLGIEVVQNSEGIFMCENIIKELKLIMWLSGSMCCAC